MPTPIIPRKNVAAAVAALREIDAQDRTDNAISEVAETLHLDPNEVAQIARDESHTPALFENDRRDRAAAETRGCFGHSDRMKGHGERMAQFYGPDRQPAEA